MDLHSPNERSNIASQLSLGLWTRVYIHGAIVFVVLCAMAYIVTRLVPIFDVTGNRPLAIVLSILAILVGPPLLGSITLFGILPLLGKRESWRDFVAWEDRLLSEVSRARKEAQVVLIDWPSKEVRTMGVLTTTFTADGADRQMASVYVPTAPQTRYGYIRVVPLDAVEFTDWTFKQWQLYQLTFGTVSPDQFRDNHVEG